MTDILGIIKTQREVRGWSEYQLAERSGLPQSTISSWYKKDMTPSFASLEKISDAFGITLSQFFADGEESVVLTPSQRNITGTAILKLRPYGFETVGVDSDNDLTKSKLGEYGETQTGWTADEAKGFIKVSSTPLRVYYGMHPNEER